METPRSAWYPRRVLIVPSVRIAYLWRQASWLKRGLAILGMVVFQFVREPHPPSLIFGVPISDSLLRLPQAMFLVTGFLQLGASHLQPDLPLRGLGRLRRPHASAVPVTVAIFRDGKHIGADEGLAWADGGRLYFEGQRFSAGFTAEEAERNGLRVEIGRPLEVERFPSEGWHLRFHPQRRLLHRNRNLRPSLNAQVRAWRTAPSINGSGILPPDVPADREPWFVSFGASAGQSGVGMALFFFVIAGMESFPNWVRAIGAVLVLPCVVFGFATYLMAKRAARESDRAQRAVFEEAFNPKEIFVPHAAVAEPETVHHRA